MEVNFFSLLALEAITRDTEEHSNVLHGTSYMRQSFWKVLYYFSAHFRQYLDNRIKSVGFQLVQT